jgi:sulfur carrier protein
MKIAVNGAWHELPAVAEARSAPSLTLEALLLDLGYADRIVATALNGEFVPAAARREASVYDGDRVEVLAPMQGG